MTRKKPVELHLIRGNSSKQRFTSSPLRPALRDAPFEPPDYLTIEARDEWLRLSGPLHELGLLTSLNVSVFAAYCTTYAKWRADRVLAGARGGAGHESPDRQQRRRAVAGNFGSVCARPDPLHRATRVVADRPVALDRERGRDNVDGRKNSHIS